MQKRSTFHSIIKLVVFTACFFLLTSSVAMAADIQSLKAQKEKANRQLLVMLNDYTQACADYKDAADARKKAESDLEKTNDRMGVLSDNLSTRAVTMYRQGPYSTLDLLLGSTTFKEFAATWDILTFINEQHISRIKEMKTLKEKQGKLVKTHSEQEEKAAAIMKDIEKQTKTLDTQIDQLEKSIKKLQKQQDDQAVRIAQAAVAGRPTTSYPMPENLGDGAWDSTIKSLLDKWGLSQSWLPTIRNIIWRESTNNPNARNGQYVGLCQFGPTWDPPRGWKGTGDWRYDPVASIERMVQYIAATGGLGNHWAQTNY